MAAFTYRMPVGIPGSLNRAEHATVEAQIIDSAAPPTKYGIAVKLVSGLIRGLAASDAGSVVYGFLVRPFPTQSSTDPLGTSTPPTSGPCDVLRRGYIMVKVALGTVTKNLPVYVVTTAGGSVVVGDLVTAASPAGGGTAVLIAGAVYTGPADADGSCEIAYNI